MLYFFENSTQRNVFMITAPQLVDIIRYTLNYIDPRLVDHGRRVAGVLHRVLRAKGGYDGRQIRDIGIAALLHDIGAYKTEEINQLVQFETSAVWAHSIYSFLYLKYFSPIANLAPAVFFHHADFDRFSGMGGSSFALGHMMHIADRMDILSQYGNAKEKDLRRVFFGNPHFNPETVELFADSGVFADAPGIAPDMDVFGSAPLDEREVRDYLRMLYLTIDFRSPQTVTHTAAVAEGARALSEILGLSPESRARVEAGAMIHDLGKQGIPLSILESPGRLSRDEMEIMKLHVVYTDRILDGRVPEDIRRIAVRHHEKLDGSGYPFGLIGKFLTLEERLVAVADIFSALAGVRSYKESLPRERVGEIMGGMASSGYLDSRIVSLLLDNYEPFLERINRASRAVVDAYGVINHDFGVLNREVALHCEGKEVRDAFSGVAREVF